MRRWSVALAWTVSLAPAAILSAAEPPGDVRIASLVSRLGADEFTEREAAAAALETIGDDSRQALEAATRHEDPEIRLRAKSLLRGLNEQALWMASRAHWNHDESSASSLLLAVAEQTGNSILLGDQYGTFRDRAITLGGRRSGDFWPLVDEICRESQGRVRPHYDTRQQGLVIVSGEPGQFPTAYCGPVRSQITAARRAFSEELDYENLKSEESHTFQFNLQMMWEDRLRLVAYRSQPELIEARAPGGATLQATQPSAGGWNAIGGGSRQLSMCLRLHPPQVEAKELENLTLRWGLIAVGDMATIEVTSLDSTEPRFQDDVELVVDSVTMTAGGRCDVSLSVVRDLILPEPQEILFQENEVELFDAAGRPFSKQGQTGTVGERGANLKIAFVGESPDSQPALLRFHYPRIRSQRDVELVFEHVPLPVARPE